ncbi:MAG: PAS domain S-box protein, partial [Desertifilum sp. SIO1I2]|nr:PAS domain S-box protein [Desertifilum sp. SIO1I2]
MARAKAIYSESGEPLRSLGVLLDISDRKSIEVERQRADEYLQLAHTQLLQRTEQLEKVNLELHQALEELQITEEQLRRSNHQLETTILAVQLQRQRYEDLFNFAPDGYLVTDSYGIVQEANQAAGNLLHRHSSALVGKPLAVYIGKEDKLRFRTYLAELQPLWGRQTYELTIQPHQIKAFPAAIAASTIRNPQGQIISIRWLIQDISDRKQAEESLRRSEAKFRSLSEASPVGIFMTDIQGHCIYTNPCCQEICGYTFEEALGEGWLQFIHPEERQEISARWFKSVSQRQEIFGETCYVRKDGSLRFGRVRSAPLFSDTGELMGYVGTIEDITESRAIETMKDEFISIVSHELRTPLTAIRGSLGLLASGVLNNKPEVAQQMVEIASQDTERLVRLVNDILDLERLESQRVRLNLQWWDAATLLEKSVKTVQPLAAESDISILIEPTSAQVWADGDLLIQTLVNLIGNAIKFSPPNTTVTLKVQNRDDRVLFHALDRSLGIKP